MAKTKTEDDLKDYDDLREYVDELGGVATVGMLLLRDLHGAGKLGVHVRAGISNELKKVGLAHAPEELPGYQYDAVRLYVMGSAAGQLIEAVLEPSADLDERIREAANDTSTEILTKVRELVCS